VCTGRSCARRSRRSRDRHCRDSGWAQEHPAHHADHHRAVSRHLRTPPDRAAGPRDPVSRGELWGGMPSESADNLSSQRRPARRVVLALCRTDGRRG
jgi:hypothetical protein